MLFVVIAGAFLLGGFLLWRPEHGGPSTAQSDLGLKLVGGGLALVAGYVVSRAVFVAQGRIDRELRRNEDAHARANRKLMLSMQSDLRGVDLRGQDLSRMYLRDKNLKRADLREADLHRATIIGVS
jgi:hypothetical protein